MILDCLSCHRPVPAPNGIKDTTRYQTLARCGTCGAEYLITVEQLKSPELADADLSARRNRTT